MHRAPFLLKPAFAAAMAAWHRALESFAVRRVAVYSPAALVLSGDNPGEMTTLQAVWPAAQPALVPVIRELTRPITRSLGSLVEIGQIAGFPDLNPWRHMDLQSYMRVTMPVAGGQGVDLFHFFDRAHDDLNADGVVAPTLMHWPSLRMGLLAQVSPLTSREVKCLAHAFGGLTARETGKLMDISERTVNSELQSAIGKLGVNNKLAAVQRACWLGHF